MATAFKFPPRKEAAANDVETALRNDRKPVSTLWENELPLRYIVREISLELEQNGLQWFYKNPGLAIDFEDGEGIEDVVEELLNPGGAGFEALAAAAQLARSNPLDLNVNTSSAYVIFILDPVLNWTFSPDKVAITHKDAANDPRYGGLRHVLGSNNYSPVPDANCRMIFFIADPPAGEYVHGFNFNIELIQVAQPGSPAPSVLPLEVDPDIRNPDGSPT